ncbi:MAG: ABC transporter permease, partial [Acidobacteria bacterium]|nr:ABC transporter permease [Acidobacteriota bacterium]
MRSASPAYFSTLGIPIISGRDFTHDDRADTVAVAIISSSTARRLFGAEDPLGRRLFRGSAGGGILTEIVGVVEDVRLRSLSQVNDVEFYRPFRQRPNVAAQIAIRVRTDPSAFVTT